MMFFARKMRTMSKIAAKQLSMSIIRSDESYGISHPGILASLRFSMSGLLIEILSRPLGVSSLT